MKRLLQWLGASDDTITKLALAVLQYNETKGLTQDIVSLPEFKTVELPEGARPINNWDDWQALEPTGIDENLFKVAEYMKKRQLNIDDYNFHWTPKLGYRDRLIVPFYYKGDVVGWTARKVTDGNPKYLSEQQPGYVFNMDAQDWTRKFVIVTEGPFDAITISGVSILGSEINDIQRELITGLNRQVIVIPDRDKPGQKLVDQATEYGWSVAFPEWPKQINDVADAVAKYGRLFVLQSDRFSFQAQRSGLVESI